jgi:hypothetical protein
MSSFQNPTITHSPLSDEDKAMIVGRANTGTKIIYIIILGMLIIGSVFYVLKFPALVWMPIFTTTALLFSITILLQLLARLSFGESKQIITGTITEKYTHFRNVPTSSFHSKYAYEQNGQILYTEWKRYTNTGRQRYKKSYTTYPGLYFMLGENCRVRASVGDFMDYEVGDVVEIEYIKSQQRILRIKKK